jgi:hypothetical protein
VRGSSYFFDSLKAFAKANASSVLFFPVFSIAQARAAKSTPKGAFLGDLLGFSQWFV